MTFTLPDAPTVGPDKLGPAGPAWTYLASGHTARGLPWVLVRKRGGQQRRVTVAGWEATDAGIAAAVLRAVASLRDGPFVDRY